MKRFIKMTTTALLVLTLLSMIMAPALAFNQSSEIQTQSRDYNDDTHFIYVNRVMYQVDKGSTVISYPKGSTGYTVGIAQRALNSFNGYLYSNAVNRYVNTNCGTVDEIFGYNTYSATCEYQRYERLTVDGEIGINTWNKIAALSKFFYDNGYMLSFG